MTPSKCLITPKERHCWCLSSKTRQAPDVSFDQESVENVFEKVSTASSASSSNRGRYFNVRIRDTLGRKISLKCHRSSTQSQPVNLIGCAVGVMCPSTNSVNNSRDIQVSSSRCVLLNSNTLEENRRGVDMGQPSNNLTSVTSRLSHVSQTCETSLKLVGRESLPKARPALLLNEAVYV